MENQKIPPGYKKTEIGIIPEDWEVVRFKDFVYFQEGPGLTSDLFKGRKEGIPFLNIRCIQENKILKEKLQYISEDKVKKHLRHFLLKENDIVVTSSGTLGRSVIIKKGDLPLLLNTSIIRMNPLRVELYRLYLKYFIESLFFQKEIYRLSTGSAQSNYGPSHLKKIPLILPPLPEQRAIARILSDIDALIESLDKLIEKKKNIKKGAMQELLTGKRRLQGFGKGKGYKKTELGLIPEDWEVNRLGDFVKLEGGYSFESEFFCKTGIPIIRISNIQNQRIDFKNLVYYPRYLKLPNRFIVKNGDILIAMSGATTGKVGLYKKNKYSYQNQRVGKFAIKNENRVNSEFLFYIVSDDLFKEKLKKKLEQAAQPNISGYQIEDIEIFLPPPPEQRAIARILSDMDAEIEALERKKKKYEMLKKGAMEQLLTGKVRVIEKNGKVEVLK